MASLNAVIEGLKILARHDEKGLESHSIGAEHDIIYAGPSLSEKPIPSEDRERLRELGWHFDREVESWARFV